MTGIVKVFPGVRALDGVDLDVRAGEVHCLLGQNGAGKSTLIKVLSGAHHPDEGTIHWNGELVRLATPMAAMRLGIATIYQELDLVNDLTVAENITLGHEPSRIGFAERRSERNAAVALLKRLGHPEISPSAVVGNLSGCRQADRQHGPSTVPRREADDHGRALGRPRPGRGRPAVRGDPRPDRQRRRRHLHLPPTRGDPRDRRSRDRAQGRPHGGHGPAGQDHPDRRCHPADDGPHHRVRLPAAQRTGLHRRRRCSTCRASRAPGSSRTSRSRCIPARSSGWPAWSAPGARRSSRRSTAPAGSRPAR